MVRPPILVPAETYTFSKYFELPFALTDILAEHNYLRGTLDYFMPAKQSLLVVESKQPDLVRGFTQLSAELLALDQ
jgi:hypothetical protein